MSVFRRGYDSSYLFLLIIFVVMLAATLLELFLPTGSWVWAAVRVIIPFAVYGLTVFLARMYVRGSV